MEKFTPDFESLYKFTAPEWFRDSKFGIWSHWGAGSVPMYGDWYARNMYIQDTDQYRYHIRKYGHPSKFGYKDICALWKADKFDPYSLMDLYYKAGARYFVALAMHHDHFFNYKSAQNSANSVNIGPKKDILALWRKAAMRYNLPFGVSEHLGASFSWWRVNKASDTKGPHAGIPYDGNDINFRHFYHDNYMHDTENPVSDAPWYTSNEAYRRYWADCMIELIDKFEPDLLYSDGILPFGERWKGESNTDYSKGLEVAAYLYNKSIKKHGVNRAVFTQKSRDPNIYKVGVLDVEKSQLSGIAKQPWHTDTCIGNWFYDVRVKYKEPSHIIEILVDVISKNGTMLLNILQRPNGQIDAEARYILYELSKWFAINSEAVYKTRPWKVFGEGPGSVIIDGFREDETKWTADDYRFVKKENMVYVFMIERKGGTAIIRSFNEGERIRKVKLIGYGKLCFTHKHGVLLVKLPEKMPASFVNCLGVQL